MQIKCACGKILRVPDAMAGKNGKCPGCGKVFKIPAAGGAAPPAAPEEKTIAKCSCGKVLAVPASAVGKKVRCPGCQNILTVSPPPSTSLPPPQLSLSSIGFDREAQDVKPDTEGAAYGMTTSQCPNCRAEIEPGAQFCVACGTHLVTGNKVAAHEAKPLSASRMPRVDPKLVKLIVVVAVVLLLVVGGVYAAPKYVGPWVGALWQKVGEMVKEEEQNQPPKKDQPKPPGDEKKAPPDRAE